MSEFKKDLNTEQLLGKYLDKIYSDIFNNKVYTIQRVKDLSLQMKGVDIVLKNATNEFMVDEKAQTDYLNKSLPTFAFEISYEKDSVRRVGWLIDKSKITDIYLVVTDIRTKSTPKSHKDFYSVRITGIYRNKLLELLENRGLSLDQINYYNQLLIKNRKHGKHPVSELNQNEGYFFYSLNNKAEKPINLVLKLDFLCSHELVAKKIYPTL